MLTYRDILNKKISVTQICSSCKLNIRQKSCLIGLGLGKIGNSATLDCDKSNLGMIKKVHYLLKIEEVI